MTTATGTAKTAQWRRWFDSLTPERKAELVAQRRAREKARGQEQRRTDPEAYNARYRGYYQANIDVRRAQGRVVAARYQARLDPEVRHQRSRRENLRWLYDLSVEQYDAMFASQNGVCAICQKPEVAVFRGRVRSLSVDHDHATGRVRGLLCNHCNRGIGLLRDNPDNIRRALAYLEGPE